MTNFNFDSSFTELPNTTQEAVAQGNVPQSVVPPTALNNDTINALMQMLRDQQQANQAAAAVPEPPVESLSPLQRLERIEATVNRILQSLRRFGPIE